MHYTVLNSLVEYRKNWFRLVFLIVKWDNISDVGMSHSQVHRVTKLNNERRISFTNNRHNLNNIFIKHQGDKLTVLTKKNWKWLLSSVSIAFFSQNPSTGNFDPVLYHIVIYQSTVESVGQHEKVLNLWLNGRHILVKSLLNFPFPCNSCLRKRHCNAVNDLIVELRV